MPDVERQDLQNRFNWVIFFRFLVVLVFVGSLRLLDPSGKIYSETEISMAFRLLSGLVAVNLLYFVVSRVYCSSFFFASQFFMDIAFELSLVYLTGGLNSPFAVVPFATILAASILVSARMGLVCASLVVTGQAFVTSVYFYHFTYEHLDFPILPPDKFKASVRSIPFYVYYLLVQSAAYYLVAVLAGRLASQRSEDRLVQGEILQNLGEGVIVADADGRVFYVNKLAMEYLQTPENQIVGQRLFAFMNKVSPGLARRILDLEEGLHEIHSEDGGAPRSLQFSTAPIRGQRGALRGTIVVIRNRTSNRELENSRVALARMKALSEMGAGIAHEIRNPLASIRGSVQELAGSAREDSPDQRLMNIILKESDRLDGILTEFLRFASMKKASFYRCNLRQLLEEVILFFGKREDAAKIKIQLRLPADPAGELLVIKADQEQLRQVFLNLLVNAGQAMDWSGEVTVEAQRVERLVRLSRYEGEHMFIKRPGVQIEVRDTGPGLPPEAKEKLFMPFFTTKRAGTGMGLAMVSRIVNEHYGHVSAVNQPQGGAVFTVWLPDEPMDADEAAEEGAE